MKQLSKYVLILFLLLNNLLLFAQRENNIVMVMPFCGKQIIENPNHSDAMLSNLCREYYQGAMIAIDSLERAKIKVKLSVFDTQNDSDVLVRILKKQDAKSADLFIGPVLQGGNKVLTDFTKDNDVMHVSPLMTFSKTKLNDPNFIAPNPKLPMYAKLIIEHISQQDAGSTILLISDKSGLDKTIIAAVKQVQSQNKLVKVKIVDFDNIMSLVALFSAVGKTHIILPSSSEQTVKQTLRSIKDLPLADSVIIYGFPQWLEFKNPDYMLWEQLHVTIATPYFIDYQNAEVKKFIEVYREKYFTEPTESAYKGYDQLLFFANRLNTNGQKMMSKADGKDFIMLHTKFKFVKQEDKSGYQNMYLNMIRVQNLKWVKQN